MFCGQAQGNGNQRFSSREEKTPCTGAVLCPSVSFPIKQRILRVAMKHQQPLGSSMRCQQWRWTFFLCTDLDFNIKFCWFYALFEHGTCVHCSEIAQDGPWRICSVWEGPADMCCLFWGERMIFLPVYSTQHPVRTVGSDWAHLDCWGSQDLSLLHQVTADITTTHITTSTRGEDDLGRELLSQQSSRERIKAEPGWTDAKVANKNEPTSLVGVEQNAAETQPTLNIY